MSRPRRRGGRGSNLLAGLDGLRDIVDRVLVGSADVEIRHRPGDGTQVRGRRVPRAKVPTVQEFFSRDLAPDGPVRVWGTYGPGRALRLRFAGPLTASQRQQVRNFLMEVLK